MEIKEFKLEDLNGIIKLINKLHPKWFDRNALVNIPIDIIFQKCFIVKDNEKIIGFISISSQDGKPFIGWLGVDPSFHRQGVGKLLLEQAENELRKAKAKNLRVKTVVEQNPLDESYDNTVKFYKACGFELEKKFKIQKYENYTYRMGILKKNLT